MEDGGSFSFGPTEMADCIELCIDEMKLKLAGRDGTFRWYTSQTDVRIHLKYSKYYEAHNNFWYAVTPSMINRMQLHGVNEVGFVLGDYGCLRVPLTSLDTYLDSADTSDYDDEEVKHYHVITFMLILQAVKNLLLD